MLFFKTYPNVFSTSAIFQTDEINNCKIKQEINTFFTAEIRLPLDFANIDQYQVAEICEVVGTEDVTLFRGFVSSIFINTKEVVVQMKDEKALLQRKIMLADTTYTTQTITSMVNSVLTQWNTPYSETWSANITASSTTYTQIFKQGDTIYNILDSICGLENLKWQVQNGIITIKSILGEDKTSGAGYTEAIFNVYNPLESNISDVSLETTGTLSTIIVAGDGTSKVSVQDNPAIALYGPLAEYKQFRAGSLTTQATEYLDTQKQDRRVWKIKPNVGELDVNVGDIIVLRIEGIHPNVDTTANINVVAKEISFKNAQKIESVQLSDSIITIETFAEKIRKIQNQSTLTSL